MPKISKRIATRAAVAGDAGAGDFERESNQERLTTNSRFAGSLGAQVVHRECASVAEGIAELVRSKHITQVVFGRALVKDWRKYLYLSVVHRFLRESPEVDVHVVTQDPGN